ncbi:MAG: type II toxin-antitoxin system Phd/YefM family antitoxin [Rubrivivax sp.]
MTRKEVTQAQPGMQPLRSPWPLQDAKARFSELVRRAHSDGPQRVTLHGRDAVVVVDADEFDRMQGARTGGLLIDALQSSPCRDIEIEPARRAMPCGRSSRERLAAGQQRHFRVAPAASGCACAPLRRQPAS